MARPKLAATGGLFLKVCEAMDQFRVYLRAELGKLADMSQAECCLDHVRHDVLTRCDVPCRPADLVRRFASQELVDQFVQNLSEGCLRELTRTCDMDWRKNNVFVKLSSSDHWEEMDISVDKIVLQQAEPKLGHLFHRNRYELVRVANDAELWRHEPYRSWDLRRPVAFATCLGVLSGGRYRLFDGIHRAILLVRQGSRTIRIMFPTT